MKRGGLRCAVLIDHLPIYHLLLAICHLAERDFVGFGGRSECVEWSV